MTKQKRDQLARLHQNFDLLLHILLKDCGRIAHFNRFKARVKDARDMLYHIEEDLK